MYGTIHQNEKGYNMLIISETAQKLVDYVRSLGYWEFFRSENTRCLIVCLLDGAEEVSM